jgi:L-fuconate dehydratase
MKNAVWDLFARARDKPLWKLIVDFTPEEFLRSTVFRYITDVITPKEALEMLNVKESGKAEREDFIRKTGYPAYVTSAGWMGMLKSQEYCLP